MQATTPFFGASKTQNSWNINELIQVVFNTWASGMPEHMAKPMS